MILVLRRVRHGALLIQRKRSHNGRNVFSTHDSREESSSRAGKFYPPTTDPLCFASVTRREFCSVTETDKANEKLIFDAVRERFPGDELIGEVGEGTTQNLGTGLITIIIVARAVVHAHRTGARPVSMVSGAGFPVNKAVGSEQQQGQGQKCAPMTTSRADTETGTEETPPLNLSSERCH